MISLGTWFSVLKCQTGNFIYSSFSFEENDLKTVTAFPYLNIKVLILKENQISSIEKNAFRELALLEELDLSHNEITFEALRHDIFEGQLDADSYEPLKYLKVWE